MLSAVKTVETVNNAVFYCTVQIGGDRRRQIRGLWKRRFPALRAEAEVLQVYCRDVRFSAAKALLVHDVYTIVFAYRMAILFLSIRTVSRVSFAAWLLCLW